MSNSYAKEHRDKTYKTLLGKNVKLNFILSMQMHTVLVEYGNRGQRDGGGCREKREVLIEITKKPCIC